MANAAKTLRLLGAMGKTMHGNVVLNFTTYPKGDLQVYAVAYQEAGNRLVAAVRHERAYSDADACPIAFMYRHAAELYLKAILVWGKGIVALEGHKRFEDEDFLGEHSLRELLPLVKRVFGAVGWLADRGDAPKYGTFAEIEKALLELDRIDPKSFAFRYPMNKRGRASLPKRFHFNVLAFGAEMDALLRMLDGAATGVYEYFQNLASVRHGAP